MRWLALYVPLVVAVALSVASDARPGYAPAASAQSACGFILGFQFLHQQLNGIDGNCTDNEHNDPNGTGDRVQGTFNGSTRVQGYMVWQKATNTMRWTDGFRTYTYSSCGFQQRLNTQSWVWEQNPSIVIGGVVPPGGCEVSDTAVGTPPTPRPATPTPRPVIMISPDNLARLQSVLQANGLDTGDVNVARTTTYVLPSPGATVTLVAPLLRPSTQTAADLTRSSADVPVGVLQAGRRLPLQQARVSELPADIYLVKVKAGQMVFVASGGNELNTGLPADVRQLTPARQAPQTSVTYKDVCFAWNQVQVCTQPSPVAALMPPESANLNARMSGARDALQARGLLQGGDANIGATVAEATGPTAVQQQRANVLAAPSVSEPSRTHTDAPVDGALLGIFQVTQTLDVQDYPPVPPGDYAVRSSQGGGAARLHSSDGQTTFEVPARLGQVRGRSIRIDNDNDNDNGDAAEEPLAIIVDLWMVLCFFDERDLCDG